MHCKDRKDGALLVWSEGCRPVVGHDLEIPEHIYLHLRTWLCRRRISAEDGYNLTPPEIVLCDALWPLYFVVEVR
jgi:hypothetical protein